MAAVFLVVVAFLVAVAFLAADVFDAGAFFAVEVVDAAAFEAVAFAGAAFLVAAVFVDVVDFFAARSGIPMTTIVLNNSTMAIETHAMAYSHEKHRTRDLGGNYAGLAQDLGGYGERITDPHDVAGAILRARRVNESGRAALLEFITSAETAFSHRRGAA